MQSPSACAQMWISSRCRSHNSLSASQRLPIRRVENCDSDGSPRLSPWGFSGLCNLKSLLKPTFIWIYREGILACYGEILPNILKIDHFNALLFSLFFSFAFSFLHTYAFSISALPHSQLLYTLSLETPS